MRIVLVGLALSVGATAQTYDNLDATLWVQSSVEYRAAVRQTFAAATHALDRALETPYWTAALEQSANYREKPPAIILDADETVIENAAYRAQRLQAGGLHFTNDSWTAWIGQGKAALLPGAREFLTYARMRGVAVFLVTNRDCKAEPADSTQRNLNSLGLDFAKLLCRTTTSDKSPRRAWVADQYRVLLLIGDDFNDFVTAEATLEGRREQFDRYGQYFGERWFIVPNPMYGSWERTFGDDTKKKLGGLRP